MGGLGWFWGFGVRLPRTGPGGSGPFRAGPNQSRLVRTGLVQTGPARFGLFRTGPFRTGPIRTNPDRCGPVHAIPTLFFGPWIVQKRNLILLVGPTGQQTRTPPFILAHPAPQPTCKSLLHSGDPVASKMQPLLHLARRGLQKSKPYCTLAPRGSKNATHTICWCFGVAIMQPLLHFWVPLHRNM